MIEFIDQLGRFALAATPWLAVFACLAGLFSSVFRPGTLVGLGCALLGGMIGAAACSGHGYNSGWGAIAMIVFGIEGACTGFLLGLGGYGVCVRGDAMKIARWCGVLLILSGLLVPAALVGRVYKNHVVRKEALLWQGLLTTANVDRDIAFYRANFSAPTREWLRERLGRREQGLVPTPVLDLLDQLGVAAVAEHPNLSDELAWRIYRNPPLARESKSWLAGNPTIPVSLQNEMARSGDPNILYSLALNKKLDARLRERLIEHFTSLHQKALLQKDYWMTSSTEHALTALRGK